MKTQLFNSKKMRKNRKSSQQNLLEEYSSYGLTLKVRVMKRITLKKKYEENFMEI